MNTRKEYGAIDYFRIAAAFMIVAIHTGPLEDISKTADFLVTYCVGRIAVPFFLMVTGYFILSDLNGSVRKLAKYLIRFLLMYIGVTLLYLPFTVYAGNLPHGVGGWLKWFFMDGSFYHLWYLPAALLGCVITAALLRWCPVWVSGGIVAVLYAAGLMGDSWYGLVSQVEPLSGIYDALFCFSSYTRNGIFYAPVFLWLGAVMGGSRKKIEMSEPVKGRRTAVIWGLFAVCLGLMLGEGFFTWSMGLQKHNSMYLMLIPVSVLLFLGLLRTGGKAPGVLRPVSMWIYLLHPLCIIGVRGVAKVLHLQKILVDNALVFYVAVCISSFMAAAVIEAGRKFWKRTDAVRRMKSGNCHNQPTEEGNIEENLSVEDMTEEISRDSIIDDITVIDLEEMLDGDPSGDFEGEDEDVSQGKSVDRTEGGEPEGECGGIPEDDRA